MADESEDVIVNIVVNNEQAIKNIAANNKAIDDLKKKQKELDEQYKLGAVSEKEYYERSAAITSAKKSENDALRANQKELQNNQKQVQSNSDSLVAMRANLSNLYNEYDNLSKADRQSTAGVTLQKHIHDLSQEILTAEKETDRFQRQVGHYEIVGETAAQSFREMQQELKQLRIEQSRFTSGSKEFEDLGKKINDAEGKIGDLNDILKTTVGSGVERFNSSVGLLREGLGNLDFDKIKIGLTGVNEALKANAILILADIIVTILDKLGFFQKGLEAIEKVFGKISDALGFTNHELDKYGETLLKLNDRANTAIDRLTELNNALGMKGADLRGSQIKLEALGKNIEDFQNRVIAAQKSYSSEELKIFRESKDKFNDYQKEKLQEAVETFNKTGKATRGFSEDQLKSLSELYKRENELTHENTLNIIENTKRVQEETRKLILDEKKKNEELLKLNKELIDKQNDLRKQWAQIIINENEDELSRTIALEKEKTRIENEELKKRLSYGENLTKESRKIIEALILNNDLELQRKITELNNSEAEKRNKESLLREQKNIDLRLKIVKQGTDKELELQLQALEFKRQAAIEAANKEGLDVQAINIDFDNQENELTRKHYSDLLNAQLLADEERVKARYESNGEKIDNEIERAQEQVDIEKERLDTLLSLDRESKEKLGLTDKQYSDLVIANRKKISDAEKNVQIEQQRQVKNTIDSMLMITAGIEQVLTSLGEKNKSAAQAAKALALFRIGVNTATGISAAISAAAAAGPFPANLIAAAPSIASVLSNVAAATSIIQSLQEPEQPGFAKGGLIESGQRTITVNEQGQESVNNAMTTKMFSPLLSTLNQIGGGASFQTQDVDSKLQGEEMLARAFVKGALAIPPPVVSVDEINQTNKRVQAIEII